MVVASKRSTRKSSTKDTKSTNMKKNKSNKTTNTVSRVDKALVDKAVAALVKFHGAQSNKKEEARSTMELLGNDRPVQVQFGLETAPVDSSLKPIRVHIPNPILQVEASKLGDDDGLEEPDVCLFVKEESKAWVTEMIEEHKEHMGCIKKVLGLDSLRKKHSRFQQRRELMQKYDVFMADDRILPMLTSALGSDFVKAKKLPMPIRLTRKEALPLAIQKNLSATYMTVSRGTSIMVKAGNTGMSEKKLAENIVAIAENAVKKIPRKWANVRSISIKTPDSTSLPFYHKLPEELLEIAKMAGVAPAFTEIIKDDNKKADDDKKSDDGVPKKRELAGKSPLVRALKKQKKSTKEDAASTTTSKKSEKEEETPKKVVKRSKSLKESKKRSIEEKDDSEEPTPKGKKAAKSAQKKPRKESDAEEQGDYVASKKFKGSKKGYVFKMAKEGLGYYKDVKPVVDKMVLAALARSAPSPGSGSKGKRGKSVGKRKGGRR